MYVCKVQLYLSNPDSALVPLILGNCLSYKGTIIRWMLYIYIVHLFYVGTGKM
jgi:hypothetical protein